MFSFFIHTDDNSSNSKIHFSLILLYMKKFAINILSLLFIASALISCDKIPDGIIDYLPAGYKIISIKAPSTFTFSVSDSMITTSVEVQNVQSVRKIWYSVKSVDGTQAIISRLDLYDDGDIQNSGDRILGEKIYSGKFGMSKKYSNGKYQIEYFVEDNSSPSNIVKVGVQNFSYDNGQTNFTPVLSNLIIPVSVNRGESFTFTIKAEDPNGPSDIASVFYRLYKPDGTLVVNSQGISEFPMFDDGNSTNNGDKTAGDGIYSVILSFPASQPIGVWKFEFQAKDKGTPFKLSNVITFNLIVN